MRKTALFVFNGSSLCFVHVLLNALDMKGHPGMAAYRDKGFEIITF